MTVMPERPPGGKRRDVIRMSADEVDRHLSDRHTLAAAISRCASPAKLERLDPMLEHMNIVIARQRVVSRDHSKLGSSGRCRP
jgi:hypothetical protein